MGNYKTEHGFEIKHRSSDPPSPIAGEIWYNSTTQTIKCAPQISAWASGGNLNTTRAGATGMGATNTAAVITCGNLAPGTDTNATEEYNGSAWTNSTNFPSTPPGQGQGNGPSTAGITAGDGANASTILWDGSSWTAAEDMPTTFYTGGMAGTQSGGTVAGGIGAGAPHNESYDYDGTDWTAGGNLNVARYATAMSGTTSASALIMGGSLNPPHYDSVESYDGSSWTAGPALTAARVYGNAGKTSPQTDSLFFGGATAPGGTYSTTTMVFDGSSWANTSSLSTGRSSMGGAGSQVNALCAGGKTSNAVANAVNSTEEWTSAATTRSVDTT